MRKTLFVGFDGVMHGTFQAELAPFCRLPLLEEVLVNQPVDIVVSSSRQHLYSFSEIQAMFGKLSGQVVDCTDGQLFGKYTRYREIMEYVKALRILDWRALDDAARRGNQLVNRQILWREASLARVVDNHGTLWHECHKEPNQIRFSCGSSSPAASGKATPRHLSYSRV